MDIFIKESNIFSREWKEEDIQKILKLKENDKDWYEQNENDIYEEDDDKKINLEEYNDLLNEFNSYFNQTELCLLDNDIKFILDYFYLRELIIEEYINEKYKNNSSKRHSNLRIVDYFLRILFEENSSTYETAKLINQFISEINEIYFEKENWDDLSDNTYMNKINEVFGTKDLPKFLLRKGFRIRREIQKNLELIKKNKENINNELSCESNSNSNSTVYTENIMNNLNKENDITTNKGEKYNIIDIEKEMENNQLLPFEAKFSSVYAILFFYFLKEIEPEDKINEIITSNENIINNYFQLDIEDFKKKYFEVDSNKIKLEFSQILKEINDSEYLCYFILASYFFVINKIFSEPNYVFFNLLLFLQNYISEENKTFKNIIEKEINSNLLFTEDNTKNVLFEKYQAKIPDNYKGKCHISKKYNLEDIIDIFNNINDSKLKDRFFEIIKNEEAYERGSNFFRINIINKLKQWFSVRDIKDEDTIGKHLKLIPYKENKYTEKTILILISGYFSSNSNHYNKWKELIKIYEQRFPNPIIYFYNWPSSYKGLQKLIFHRRDFRKTRERAKYCGELLALLIMSKEIFSGFKINLTAFSLGNHVIKNCLKELERYGKLDIINNIIFMAGATNISNCYKWEKRFKSISGNIINCYSDVDQALLLCQSITEKGTIGTKKLKINNVKIKNYLISSFHVMYRVNMGELGKMFLDDLKE